MNINPVTLYANDNYTRDSNNIANLWEICLAYRSKDMEWSSINIRENIFAFLNTEISHVVDLAFVVKWQDSFFLHKYSQPKSILTA